MHSLTAAQRVILILVCILAAGALLAAGWLTRISVFSSPPTTTLPAAAVPTSLSTATMLPTPLEKIAPPPTPSDTPLIQPPQDTPLACLPNLNNRETARVLAVLAVNRIRVEVAGQEWEVRYLGVEPAGAQALALAANQALVEGQTVTLIRDAVEADLQGLRLRYVLAGESFVNYLLIQEGMAITALDPPGIACDTTFLAAERAAQAGGVGFWAMPVPTADPAALVTVAVPPCPCNTTFTCSDFSRREAAQACFNACGDYRNAALDEDHDGLACEDLP